MDALESLDLPNPPESASESGEADTNQSDKRKREDPDPEPEQSEPQQQHPLWKTSLCSYFRSSNGSCSHGDSCRYAHGEAELKLRPDNTWDPTSERAKKKAKKEPDNANLMEAEGGVMMTDAVDTAPEGDEACSSGLSKCLVNLPMKWGADKLRNFLSEQGILFESAKKKQGMVVGFVTFESAAQVKIAVEELNGKSVGNSRTIKVTDVIPRSFGKKNEAVELNNDQGDDPNDVSLAVDGSTPKGRGVRDVVTPLAHMAYADQLEHKKNSLVQTLKRLTRNARKACPNGISLPEWILKSREIGGLPCKLEGILESPLVDGYRNKCEFSVGYSLQGRPTVGFLLGNFREGVTAIEEPVDCPNVSRIACKYAAIFQEFLQQSEMPIWNRLNNTGFWRQLTVREGRIPKKVADVDNPEASISEVMLMVQVCTKGFDDGLVKVEFERMAQAFTMRAAGESPLPLTALVIQDHTGISNVASPDAPLLPVSISNKESDSGLQTASDVVEPRIHDYISNLRFSISPTAFFQVNTLAAEKLYSLAGDWAGLGPETLLFDVCCGTGTIGLTLAHRVGMVVGIEMNASAISDAQRNAEMNGIVNCRFVCGKAEDVMGSLLKEYLSLPQKQEEISDTFQRSEDEMKSAEETIDSEDCVLGPEGSSCLEHENGICPNECQLQKNSTSQNRNTVMHQFKNVVAIVDPPRVGLHPTVIKVLRTHSRLKRLVYISCNPESLVANAIELCTPSADKTEKGNNKNSRGWRNMSSAGLARHRAKSMPNSEPFKPVKAMAVDLFPHTSHCELVMLLER